MGLTPNLLWLISCLVIVLGLVALVLIIVWRRHGDAVARREPDWPDFLVVDCGDEIHFVPADEDRHVVGSGICPCHPRLTGNRRRSGRRVVYVDHQTFDGDSQPPPIQQYGPQAA